MASAVHGCHLRLILRIGDSQSRVTYQNKIQVYLIPDSFRLVSIMASPKRTTARPSLSLSKRLSVKFLIQCRSYR